MIKNSEESNQKTLPVRSLSSKPLLRFVFTVVLLSSLVSAFGQIDVEPANAAIDPIDIIETIFLGDGVEVSNIVYTGDNQAVGHFSNAFGDIGIDRGLVIGTGFVDQATGPGGFFADNSTSGGNSDPDLDAISNVGLMDISKYEITFVPTADTLRFRYVFASEEYPEFGCSNFNDVFGFFISGPNPAGGSYMAENIALVPDLADPSGTTFTNLAVSIENVHIMDGPNCPGSFEEYYNDNQAGPTLTYDAYLDVFIAQALVVPCEEYTIKLAIADGSDDQYDSAVFLEAKSFGTGSINVNIETVSLDGGVAEGCNPGIIRFSIPNPTVDDYTIDANIIDCPGSATNGVDYFGIPPTITIPAGETFVEYEFFAPEDNILEGDEFICFDIQRDICNKDTVSIKIVESPLKEVFIPNDTLICQTEIVNLTSDLPAAFVLPPSPSFELNINTLITNELEPQTFDLGVSGVVPDYLTQGMIKSVCIDTIESAFLTDIDVFLLTPSGQFLELTTDNGRDFNNQDTDFYINTCFTPFSNTPVNNGNSLSGNFFPANPNYNGEFLPEGVWSDIYGQETESNGTYQLLIIDDETGAFAKFTGWSICFNPIYNLTYEWSSSVDGLLCVNCDDFPVEVEENTTFYLTVFDSYGCEYVDSFDVEITPLLPGVTNMQCDSVAPDYIRITWDGEPSADSYEIFIPGVIDPAIDIGDVEEWAISGLDALTDYTITIRTIGGLCGGQSNSIVCMTPNCIIDPVVINNVQGVQCFGETNGLLDVSITGNFPPFSYEFSGQTNMTGTFTGLPAGQDTLYVTDQTDCVSKFPINIPGPNVLNIDFEDLVGISCFGETDAQANAEPFGGVPPYNILWESGEMGPAASMLGAGWNSVTITDLNSCILVDSINFIEPSEVTAEHLFQDVSCFGESSGIAIINPDGGTSPYTYVWGDVDNQTTQQAENLAAGMYIVTVFDDNDCFTTEEVVISQPDPLSTSVMGNNVLCFDSEDGNAFVTINGGNDPFVFLWDNGEMTNPAISLSAGQHFVTITDSGQCESVDSVTIGAPAEILVTFDVTDADCFAAETGEISWEVLGGSGDVTATINGNIVTSSLENLFAFEYCFVFTDESQCTLDTCVTINQPLEIAIVEEITLESCSNSNDAIIDITVTNAENPITYNWTGPGIFTAITEDLNGVNSGVYFVTITDANGCTQTANYNLIEPPAIVIDVNVFNIPCKGEESGILEITPSGGTEPYEFNWIGPNGFTSDEEDLIDVAAGTYTLILTDAQGCNSQSIFEIFEPSLGIVSNISSADEVCFGKTNGIASVAPSGGTIPLDITWSNDSKFTNINGLTPGWYYVTIVDGSNCSIVDSVEIIERSEMIVEVEATESLCFESFDATAEVVAIRADGNPLDLNEFEYLWNSFPLQNTIVAENLQGGADYLVIVTDNLGCTAQQQLDIETPSRVGASIDMVDSISCALGDDGSIVIEGTGGTGPYSYQWGQDANFQDGQAAKNLKSGNYDVTITDMNGCTGEEEFEILDPFPISLNYRIFDVLCFGAEDGEIELIANGGTEPYDFNWSTGNQNEELFELSRGTYFLTVTDANDCEVVDSVFVDEPQEPLTLDAMVNSITCAEGQDGSIIIEAQGGSGNYIYSLDNFIYNGSIEQIGLSEGTYTAYVKDANGCIDSIPDIDIFSPAPLTLELGPDVYLDFADTYQFDPMIGNFQNPMTFDWTSPDVELLSCVDCQNPFFEAIRQATYKLVVIDGRGCVVEDYINLYIENEDIVFVPTAFSPNNDFNNDLLSVFGKEGVTVQTFRVLDRWGEVMYENQDFLVNDTTIGWDGTFRAQQMPPGVYTWVVEAQYTNGFIKVFSGNTTLIK